MKFLGNGSRPQPPTSPLDPEIYDQNKSVRVKEREREGAIIFGYLGISFKSYSSLLQPTCAGVDIPPAVAYPRP